MSRIFTQAELKRFTLAQLHALHAQLTSELTGTAPGSAARQALDIALTAIRREIAIRGLPKPGF